MNITKQEYNRLTRGIERMRFVVADRSMKKFPFSQFDDGTEFANDKIVNDLYKALDRSITNEEMKLFKN